MTDDLPELILEDAPAWRAWLSKHHASQPGVWLVLAKKGTVEPTSVTYDQALDIDCRLIRARIQQAGIPLPPAIFVTGFLVIQSREELDVVAVYSAAPVATNQVASIHTERVHVRRVGD